MHDKSSLSLLSKVMGTYRSTIKIIGRSHWAGGCSPIREYINGIKSLLVGYTEAIHADGVWYRGKPMNVN